MPSEGWLPFIRRPRAPAQVAVAADFRGDPVFVARRAAVADAPPVLPAGFDGAALVSSMRDKGLRFSLSHEFRWHRALAIG